MASSISHPRPSACYHSSTFSPRLGGLQAWTPSGGPTSQRQPLSDIKAGRRLVNQREKKKINFPILPLEVVS